MPSDLPAGSAEIAPAARGSGAVLLTASGLAAAFAVASCCGLPFILATFGLGTAWLYSVAVLAAPHRVALLAAAAICLVGGAVLLWRQRRTAALGSWPDHGRPAGRVRAALPGLRLCLRAR